jgi:TetR/AcrR family transcriptional regulator, cholesterol catabolism regulator
MPLRNSAFARLSATLAQNGMAERAPRVTRLGSRLPAILDEAARLFAQTGYHDTSIRDIVRSTGMLPGSLYCHFDSKEDLLVAVYEQGVSRMLEAVAAAAEQSRGDAWQRLEAACIGHLEALLQSTPYALVVIRVVPDDVPAARDRLVALRDRFETVFTALIAELPLAPHADRRSLRLFLLGALNWAQFWYHAPQSTPGRDTPAAIARKLVALLREGAA